MSLSRANWVPPDAWLAPGYAEWVPPAALRPMVSCLWANVTPADADNDQLVVPDGCSDLIWEQGKGAYVAGPDTGPVRIKAVPGTVIVGARFRPAAGGQALGLPLSELRNLRVPLDELLPAQSRTLSLSLSPALPPQSAAALLPDLAGRLVADAVPDPVITRAATLLRDPAARTEDIARQLGLSDRQFRRRSHAAAGYGPKTLQRVLRFQRFVRLLDAAAELPDLAAVAARAGYADQPHLTRDCKAFAGRTPATLHRLRRPLDDHRA